MADEVATRTLALTKMDAGSNAPAIGVQPLQRGSTSERSLGMENSGCSARMKDEFNPFVLISVPKHAASIAISQSGEGL